MNTNEVYFTRTLNLVKEYQYSEAVDSIRAVATLNKNLEAFGFCFSKEAVQYLRGLTGSNLLEIWSFLFPTLKKMVGANRSYRVMYPNFPQQVMETSDAELYLIAIFHYLTVGSWMPNYKGKVRLPLSEDVKLKEIGTVSQEEVFKHFAGLLESRTNISQKDRDDLVIAISENPRDVFVKVDKIHNKEILGFVGGYLLKRKITASTIENSISTVTDVLRIAVGLNDGDVSLATPTRFESMRRVVRRYLLSIIDRIAGDKDVAPEMVNHIEAWKHLGNVLHPMENKMAILYPRASTAFFVIRNQNVKSWYGQLDEALERNPMEAIEMLSSRAGEFARRIDFLLREFPQLTHKILVSFEDVIDKVSTPVLTQLFGHIKGRDTETRLYMPKGNVAKAMAVSVNVKGIKFDVIDSLEDIIFGELVKRFSLLEKLGKVYIEPETCNYLIPYSERSASSGLFRAVRGSRIPFDSEKDILRAFVHWTNLPDSRVDIDLSAWLLDEDFKCINIISWNSDLKTSFGFHSGDIINAPEPDGASEFIDIGIEKARYLGGRYVLFTLNNYSPQRFNETTPSFGWMEREEAQSGEIFEPTTVVNRINVVADSRMTMPVLFDLEARVFVWLDTNVNENKYSHNSLTENKQSVVPLMRGFLDLYYRKMNFFEFFLAHIVARSDGLVSNRDEADFVFGVREGDVTVSDFETIISEYLV